MRPGPSHPHGLRARRPRPRPGRPAHLIASVSAIAAGLAGSCASGDGRASAADLVAGEPSDWSVTIYRAPGRASGGSIDLDALGGFALITETRAISLPAGESRVRFEGVADGIIAQSALVTGLPGRVVEKNRDAELLTPASLLAAALGAPVELLRTDAKTGRTERIAGVIRSDAEGGVVFETSEGVEALRCSGLPETFAFSSATTLKARPTLSVTVDTAEPASAVVTLSYLSENFDWAADYVAHLSPDGKTLALGAWVTLANGNGAGFPAARSQIVAGRVNHDINDVAPVTYAGPILARCWPRGSTSDIPPSEFLIAGALRQRKDRAMALNMPLAAAAGVQDVVVTALRVTQEQLGDLKLYRVPERTTIASRQSKQVRLLDRSGIPVQRLYGAELDADKDVDALPATMFLRTKNDAQHHLGLPLPSGRIAVFAPRGSAELLVSEAPIRDLAKGEELEIPLGTSPDVHVTAILQRRGATGASGADRRRVVIRNAHAEPIAFELQLQLTAGELILHPDHRLGSKDGRPLFRLQIPAHATATLTYQLLHGHAS
jgi:hypothetical protein